MSQLFDVTLYASMTFGTATSHDSEKIFESFLGRVPHYAQIQSSGVGPTESSFGEELPDEPSVRDTTGGALLGGAVDGWR
jgi:hypothetical protein